MRSEEGGIAKAFSNFSRHKQTFRKVDITNAEGKPTTSLYAWAHLERCVDHGSGVPELAVYGSAMSHRRDMFLHLVESISCWHWGHVISIHLKPEVKTYDIHVPPLIARFYSSTKSGSKPGTSQHSAARPTLLLSTAHAHGPRAPSKTMCPRSALPP